VSETTKVEKRDFLVEVGTEELPPKALRELELAFLAGVQKGLTESNLAHGEVQSFATPRRIAVWVKRLGSRQPEQDVRRKGPPVTAAFDAAGQPTRAASAFAESCGVAVDALQKIEEGKGTFLFYIGKKAGTNTVELLPRIVQASLDALPIPKRMRWGAGTAEFVRPVHWLVMLYGSEVIKASVLDVPAGQYTRGHRFMAPKEIKVTSPASYVKALRERGKVVPGFEERREIIRTSLSIAESVGGPGARAVTDDALLDEVTALVEWPVPITAQFEERFLALPREVLISTLQEHQRYFPVAKADGSLTSWFITISNIESLDPAQVRAGNERVVRPRLADAAFFWEQDRKQPLASRREALDKVTFQAKLGSVGDKVRRVRELAGEIAASLGKDRAAAERAAELSKCDLLSAMVGEFPELQGVMGGYYAAADGEAAEVAAAVREHYLPRGAGDALPATDAGVAVSVADKLDTLAGIFAIGQKPTGAKDPFGLRRAAIGILRTLIEKQLDIDLRGFIERAVALQPVQGANVANEIYDYVMERLRAYYLDSNAVSANAKAITTEMFDAVLATQPRSPVDFDARLRALSAFLELPESTSLTAANKRIANILRKSESAAGTEVDIELLREPAEVRMFDAMRGLRDAVSAATARREYTAALGQLAQLRPAVDAFFDEVMVNAEDLKLRANRLGLLSALRGLFGGIADLSRLPG
jgi:glycyl-tRNA synthetase beta chain